MKHSGWFGEIRWRRKLQNDLARVLARTLAPAEQDPPLSPLEAMTIALEDRRFFGHIGVDGRSVVREVMRALMLRRHGGFSTIDMQFVRTATGFRQHTIGRKIYEVILAIALQSRCGKRSILSSYLECAYFGTGLTGANAAAQKLFGKKADQLDLHQAAIVAAMLACPRPLNGSPGWEARVQRRAAYGVKVYAALQEKMGRQRTGMEINPDVGLSGYRTRQ
jgi:penicillin-binding protein 1A